MKKYKVISLSVGGLGNKIFSSNDIVAEDNFLPGRAEELVNQKFLKPLDDSAKEEIQEPEKKEEEISDEMKDSAKEEIQEPVFNKKNKRK